MMRDSSGMSVPSRLVGIAGSVVALVVVADPVGFLGEVRGGHDLAAERGVALHLRVLVVGEPAGLVEDRVGHADLADVVQEPGEAHARDPLGAQVELGGDERAQLGDGLAVAAGVGVLGVDGEREGVGERAGVRSAAARFGSISLASSAV